MAALLAPMGCSPGPASGLGFVAVSRAHDVGGYSGLEVRTPHYRLLTTVRDDGVIDRFVRVMESAYAEYAALVPPASPATVPLEIVLLARPEEWDAYTRRLTGADAPIYLSVGPGGYTFGDRFVCWLFNENDLWGVAAHEGFHQYVARHLPARLPPALEEGIASTFEEVSVTGTSVRINRQANARRQQGLSMAAKPGGQWPISDLIRMHAGDVAGRELGTREAFYGQCWALARVLLETPETAAGLRRMLVDLRDGRSPGVGRTAVGGLYHPAAARPLLQTYMARDWPSFERTYREWIDRNMAAGTRDD